MLRGTCPISVPYAVLSQYRMLHGTCPISVPQHSLANAFEFAPTKRCEINCIFAQSRYKVYGTVWLMHLNPPHLIRPHAAQHASVLGVAAAKTETSKS
eukprot:3342945-Rhodomonas_salina.2